MEYLQKVIWELSFSVGASNNYEKLLWHCVKIMIGHGNVHKSKRKKPERHSSVFMTRRSILPGVALLATRGRAGDTRAVVGWAHLRADHSGDLKVMRFAELRLVSN